MMELLRQKVDMGILEPSSAPYSNRWFTVPNKIVADRGELDAEEAEELFDRLGVKLSLTTAYKPEANGKVERGHGPIVKALVRACGGQVGNWPRLLPYALWADRTTHNSVLSFSFSSLSCSSVQDPRGPASVSHALA